MWESVRHRTVKKKSKSSSAGSVIRERRCILENTAERDVCVCGCM